MRFAILGLLMAAATLSAHGQEFVVVPAKVELGGKNATQRLLVTGKIGDRAVDWTRTATYRSETPAILRVGADGTITALASGHGRVLVEVSGRTIAVDVDVADRAPSVTFENDIEPILARKGCNSGPCHGKARGQNGFQLSLLGYDPQFDFQALIPERPAADGSSRLPPRRASS